ncbi:MAG: VWA domain-containing protein, partial [Candidatus Lindowbacteria bacterium]|nr:VWA domain-containing protein [Candidatus Lindowbacteria bacterium]
IDRLGPNDIVSIVSYSSDVNVIVPATKLTDKEPIYTRINSLSTDGNTALFAGVSKGIDETRKFKEKGRVNRVILLSDGIANLGPSSPAELGELGMSVGKENISVSTIGLGLGYNEDLMSQLAMKSDGNHAFVEKPEDLVQIFEYEFGDVLSVVAQEVTITIECPKGIRPIRTLGREADIVGQKIVANLNQLYSEQEKYILLEVEVPAMKAGRSLKLAKVDVTYSNMLTNRTDTLSGSVRVTFTGSKDLVEKRTNVVVMAAVVEQIATERSKLAVELRDKGEIEEAKKVLNANASYLSLSAKKYKSPKLSTLGASNSADAERVDDDAKWRSGRKAMRKQQHESASQQSY